MDKLKKKKIIILTILLGLVLIIGGVAYSWFSYEREGSNQVLITGNIYMVLESTDTLTLSNVVPETEYEAREASGVARTDNMITFTVTGTNTSSKDIYYELVLSEGTSRSGTRFHPDEVVFDLYEVQNNEDVLLLNAVSYADFTDHKIWVDKIPAGTNSEVTKTYKLREWLAQKVVISDTYANADYTTSQFSSRYATVKVGADGNLTKKDFPLKFSYANNQFLITLQDEEASTIGLSITTPNSTMKFTDVNDNETTSFTGTYNLVANTPQYITLDVSDIEQYGTDVIFSVTKNNQVVQSFMRTVYNESTKDTVIAHVTYVNTSGTTIMTQALHQTRNDYAIGYINDARFLGWSTVENDTEPEYEYGDLLDFLTNTTLYPVFEDANVMNTFPSAITNEKTNITQIIFQSESQNTINTKYAAASIKADVTYNNQGSVLAWLEDDPDNTGKYIMYVESDGINYLNTGNSLFSGYSSLKKISLNNVHTGNVTNMSNMFYNCPNLEVIAVNSDMWNISRVTSHANMFGLDTSLVGGRGTTYDASNVNIRYAIIDGTDGRSGYLRDYEIAAYVTYLNRDGSTLLVQPVYAIGANTVEGNINSGGFLGWSSNSNASSASYTYGQALNISQNTILYPVYQILEVNYWLTLNKLKTEYITYGDTLALWEISNSYLMNGFTDDYDVDVVFYDDMGSPIVYGWYLEPDLQTQRLNNQAVTTNLDLYLYVYGGVISYSNNYLLQKEETFNNLGLTPISCGYYDENNGVDSYIFANNKLWYTSGDAIYVNSGSLGVYDNGNSVSYGNYIVYQDGSGHTIKVVYPVYEVVCLLGDTEILIEEDIDKKKKRRKKKKIKDISYDDNLVVWDFDHGCEATAKPLWIMRERETDKYVYAQFEDGTVLKAVGQHRIFNLDKNMFTYLMDEENTPIGTRVYKEDGTVTRLIKVEVIHENVKYYNVITKYHMNMFANGLLTSLRLNNIYTIKDMKFVKDNRKLRNRDDFKGISDEFIDGLRLLEQPDDINRLNAVNHGDNLYEYVMRLEPVMKKRQDK